MAEDKNRKQVQDQSPIRKFHESIIPDKRFANASESGPKEGTQPIIRSRDENNNQN